MQTTCQFLGIHTDEIESAAKSCEDAMEKLGFTMDEIDDMNDYAKQDFEEIGSLSDITNSVIGCYFRATEYMIHQKFPKLRVDYDVNGFCSRFDVDELPDPMTEDEIRADWEKALDTMNYGKTPGLSNGAFVRRICGSSCSFTRRTNTGRRSKTCWTTAISIPSAPASATGTIPVPRRKSGKWKRRTEHDRT